MFPATVDTTNMSGNYTPTVWSSKLLVMFYASTCLSQISNTDYEGEIKSFGDKVVINELHNIVIRDYVKGQKLSIDEPKNSLIELEINKGKYFQFPANIVDVKQSNISFIDKWAEAAARDMKIAIEREVFADIYSEAHADNTGSTAGAASGNINLGTAGTPKTLTKDNIIDFLLDIGGVMDEQNLPDEDRNIVLPSWACVLLKGSDIKNASIMGDNESVLRNGRIGEIDRLTIYNSNLLSTVTDSSTAECTNVVACHKSALTFATQLTETETITNPDDFGKLVRGLQVYGYQVVKSEGLVHAYVTRG